MTDVLDYQNPRKPRPQVPPRTLTALALVALAVAVTGNAVIVALYLPLLSVPTTVTGAHLESVVNWTMLTIFTAFVVGTGLGIIALIFDRRPWIWLVSLLAIVLCFTLYPASNFLLDRFSALAGI